MFFLCCPFSFFRLGFLWFLRGCFFHRAMVSVQNFFFSFKRIRKKKAKQQLIRAISGLVEAAEEMQREQERRTRQAGISYIKYIEAVRERQYGIMPVYTPLFEKEGA